MSFKKFAHDFLIQAIVTKWQAKIADPTGFPDHPVVDHCWIWTGSVKNIKARDVERQGVADRERYMMHLNARTEIIAPKVGGIALKPPRLLFCLCMGFDYNAPFRLRNACGDPRCINPLHWDCTNPELLPLSDLDEAAPEPTLPEPDPPPPPDLRKKAFAYFYNRGVKGTIPPGLQPHLEEYLTLTRGKLPFEITNLLQSLGCEDI